MNSLEGSVHKKGVSGKSCFSSPWPEKEGEPERLDMVFTPSHPSPWSPLPALPVRLTPTHLLPVSARPGTSPALPCISPLPAANLHGVPPCCTCSSAAPRPHGVPAWEFEALGTLQNHWPRPQGSYGSHAELPCLVPEACRAWPASDLGLPPAILPLVLAAPAVLPPVPCWSPEPKASSRLCQVPLCPCPGWPLGPGHLPCLPAAHQGHRLRPACRTRPRSSSPGSQHSTWPVAHASEDVLKE